MVRSRLRTRLFALSLGLLGLPLAASAQVAIYEVDFDDPDKGAVNYSFYDSGFMIVPGNRGSATFVFTLEQDGEKVYAVTEDAAEVFFVSDGERSTHVARANNDAAEGGAKSSLLAIGKPDTDLFASESNLRIAKTLKGYFLASDPESGEFFDPTEGVGFVGTVPVTLRFSKSRSDITNFTNKTLDEAVDAVTRELRFRGFNPDVGENPDTGNPTNPINPTDPTDPTDPTNPIDPTDPTDPGDPTDPTNPGTDPPGTDPPTSPPTVPSFPDLPIDPFNPPPSVG